MFPYHTETWFSSYRLSVPCGNVIFVGSVFRTMRKRDFRRVGFPHHAESCFSLGRLSAPCGNVFFGSVSFPHYAESCFSLGRLSA
ncbi:MAG: hypothetical protein HDR32_01120 [Treponema sp.]|nr:hypothetical protein [Treponema sp.]